MVLPGFAQFARNNRDWTVACGPTPPIQSGDSSESVAQSVLSQEIESDPKLVIFGEKALDRVGLHRDISQYGRECLSFQKASYVTFVFLRSTF
jgi:hypothetical protein